MRICMVAYTFYEGDNRVRRYAEALVKRGDTVDAVVCGRPGQAVTEVVSGVTVYRIQTRNVNEKRKIDYLLKIMLFLLQSFVFLAVSIFKTPYRLIHVHSVPDFEVFAALIPKLFGARIILDIHDIVPELYAGKFSAGKMTILAHALMVVERVCCWYADHVIIANHLWEKKLVARSVSSKKCTTMLNYPDPAIFNNNLIHNPGSAFCMVYPGTLSWHQGLDIAIRAINLIREELAAFQFDIYGRGSEEQALKDLTASLGLSERIRFHGILPLDVIAGTMAMSDLGIIPKRADDFGNEAFSTKIFEFMAVGVPVLIANTKIDRFYFNDSVVLFFESGNERELADKILFMAKNKVYRTTQTAQASEFIKQYSWNVKKDEYFAIVDRLTGNHKAAA